MFRRCDTDILGVPSKTNYVIEVDDIDTAKWLWSSERVLEEACRYGSLFLVKTFLAHDVAIGCSLGYACEGGHNAIADLLVKYIKQKYSLVRQKREWNFGLAGSCAGGHSAIAYFMISMGANGWHHAFEGACEGGHETLMNMIEHHYRREKRKPNILFWNAGLQGACRGGHDKIVHQMITNGADCWDEGLHNACEGGHKSIIDLLIAKGARDWNLVELI